MSQPGNSSRRQPKSIVLAISVTGLLMFFGLALEAAIQKSPTADEGMHLLRAQVLRQTNDLSLQGQHTPLSHWLIGSFFFTETALPAVEKLPSWPGRSPDGLVNDFLWRSGVDVDKVLLLGRLPIIFAGLLIGAMVAHWAFSQNGLPGLLIATALFAFSPNLLASAALATTDLVATASYLAALLTLWHLWRRPSPWLWLAAGAALGLAISAKLTGLILLPITLMLCYLDRRSQGRWQPGLLWLSLLPVAGLVLWAAYKFEIGPVTGFAFPIPAPTFFGNFLEVKAHVDRGHYAFLMGQRSNAGWWYYFVLVYLFKTPLTTLILLVLATITITIRRRWRPTVYFWLPAAALFAAASYSRLNIGYRHILPIVPLIWLLISETGALWQRHSWGRHRLVQTVLVVLLIFYAISGLRQRPHFLAYFNELAGVPAAGFRYFGDSNIDWGQDLRLLVDYVNHSREENLFVSYFGSGDMGYYSLSEPPLFDREGDPLGFAPANPAPGRYLISVNHLQGATDNEPDLFDWFRRLEPGGNLGYSILIFDVKADRDGAWIGHCYDPEPYLSEDSAEGLVGREDLRHIYFDCRTAWVFPQQGPGWIIVPKDIEPAYLLDRFPDTLTLVYQNTNSQRVQPYDVYYWSGTDEMAEVLATGSEPVVLSSGEAADLPLEIPGVARFIGGFSEQDTWASAWQVLETNNRPLSVLLHLYSDGPQPAVGDGLGFSPIQWQRDDIFIQFHTFFGVDGAYLETGLYNYQTGERLLMEAGGKTEPSVRVYRRP